jgi:hypothetical protein
MKRVLALAVGCALIFPTMAGGKTAGTKPVPSHEPRQVSPQSGIKRPGLILGQDLFDRNNPNNLRSDWPAPPAMPAQY